MDTLSSMANIGGYKGVLLAAVEMNRYFPMLTTAAGMVFPAKVFVIGAGVAGLQAIATARRLGANVVATDVRPGGEGADRERRRQVRRHRAQGERRSRRRLRQGAIRGRIGAAGASCWRQECAQSDVVITTALIGGVFAPRLITAETVRTHEAGLGHRRPGGRRRRQLRALASPDETVHVGGVTILAPLNLPATMPLHASLLFSRNLTAFVLAFTKDKAFQLDFNDDIQQDARHHSRRRGQHARTREALRRTRSTR